MCEIYNPLLALGIMSLTSYQNTFIFTFSQQTWSCPEQSAPDSLDCFHTFSSELRSLSLCNFADTGKAVGKTTPCWFVSLLLGFCWMEAAGGLLHPEMKCVRRNWKWSHFYCAKIVHANSISRIWLLIQFFVVVVVVAVKCACVPRVYCEQRIMMGNEAAIFSAYQFIIIHSFNR